MIIIKNPLARVGFLFYADSMSFGLLKHFKDHKKGYQSEQDSLFVRNVLVGHDLGIVLKLIELRKTEPHESIKLISQRPLNRQLLIENYQFGVSQLRSQNAVGEIYKTFFNAQILPQKNDPQFYKDGKFHDFSGRAKPMELRHGESFFKEKGFRLQIASLFSEEDWNNLDQIINQHIDLRILEGIEKTEANTLVDKHEWLLSFKDYKKFNVENLYFSLSPKKFITLLKNKDQGTPDLIDFCTSLDMQTALSVSWELDKEVFADDRTLLIPQSMTHEWGHFILEFEPYNYATKSQMCHALFLVHEEEPQSEDLASKIKLLKRVVDRVFPSFEQHIKGEFIRFDEEMFISNVKDNLIEQISFDYPTLKFVGQTGPMTHAMTEEKFLARVLLS